MDDQFQSLPVTVIFSDGRERGSLTYEENGAVVETDSGLGPSPNTGISLETQQSISIEESGRRQRSSLQSPLLLAPDVTIQRQLLYKPDRKMPEPLYPPSSMGWLSRIDESGQVVYAFIHEIREDSRYWISIVDSHSHSIYESHVIQPYELAVLELNDEIQERAEMLHSLYSGTREPAQQWMESVLAGPPPTWSQLATIMQNVSVPGLRIAETVGETLDPLVPSDIPEDVRRQLLLFLALIIREELPKEDPVEFFERIYSLEDARGLLMGHFQCVLNEASPPAYLHIMHEAELSRVESPRYEVISQYRRSQWLKARYKIYDEFASAGSVSFRYVTELNASGEIMTRLPVSGSEALASRSAWKDRLALLFDGLQLRSYPEPRALGLVRLVYTGFAHRWPHNHMSWAADLGSPGVRQPHVQVMEMPRKAADKVMRLRPAIMEVGWSKNTINGNLYHEETGKWRVRPNWILSSVEGSRSVRRLRNEFGGWKGKSIYFPSDLECRILDLTSHSFYLSDFEQQKYRDYWGITEDDFYETLTELKEKDVVSPLYWSEPAGLMSMTVHSQGEPQHVCSLARGFLKRTPSTLAMLDSSGSSLMIVSRLPTDVAHEIMTELPARCSEVGVNTKCSRISSYRSYAKSLYSRLRRPDGTWDDDVSAMLSQIRVPFKNA